MPETITVAWEGRFLENHSLAITNGQIVSRLRSDARYQWRLITPESQVVSMLDPDQADHSGKPADIYVSHQWPPRMTKPDAARWISIIPWEFGAIPVSWYIPMKYGMNEIWVYSRYNKDAFVKSGLPEDKIRVIPLGVDELVFHPGVQPAFFEGDGRFRFLYVGGTIARKGFDLLLKAYRLEFKKDEPVCLVVKDHGSASHYRGMSMEQHIREAQADPLSPSIEYMDGQLTPEQLASLYRSCHCSVFPYRGEGFGLPIAESAACGTPVIVPRRGPAAEMFDEDHALFIHALEQTQDARKVGDLETVDFPWWIEPDLNDLRRQMRFAFENKAKLAEMGKRASAHIRSRFTWNKTAEAVGETLQTVHRRWKPPSRTPDDIIRAETELAANDLAGGRPEQALGRLQGLLHAFPDNLGVRLQTAHLYMRQEKFLPAIGLLAPLSREWEEKRETVDDSLYAHIWTLLAICYCRIQSWALAIDAFRKAGELNPGIHAFKIPFLLSSVRSLHVLLGYVHEEIGDAYAALNHDVKAREMYHKALVHDSRLESAKQRLDQLEKRRIALGHKMKPVLDFSRRLLETAERAHHVRWVSADDGAVYPHDFVLRKTIWNTFFMPGQNVRVISAEAPGLPEQPDGRGAESGNWDGALFFLEKPGSPERCISWFQWCTRNIRPGGRVIVHSQDPASPTYLAFCSLFDYGGWNPQGKHPVKVNEARSGEEFAIFQCGGVGVLWQSPLHSATGYASEQRHFLQSLRPYPLLIQLNAMDAPTENRKEQNDDFRMNCAVLKESPLIHYQAAPANLFALPRAPLSVGRTMFETDRLPEEWVRILNELTEVWVPSTFNKETFVHAGVIEEKIRVVPGTIDETRYNPLRAQPWPLPGARRFRLLSVFDWSIRKGWDLLLRAYLESFTSEDDVTLVLKVSKINEPAARVHQAVEQMIKESGIRRPPHIMVIDSRLSEEEMIGLYAACDTFVLPTRGEGWGRPFMEAMALEIPVIGTNWSGHLEFMNEHNSYLIEVERMVTVPESMPAHFHGHRWAEPSVEHLKTLMLEVYRHRERAKEKAKEARKSLFPRFSMKETGRIIYSRFDHLIRNYLK